MTLAFVEFLRETLIWKCSGLPLEQAARPAAPSTMSLLGIIKHIAYVERSWFQIELAGLDVPVPWTSEDPDADWLIETVETVESVVAFYRAEIARSNELVAGLPWDHPAKGARSRRDGLTLGWILTHMVEETARHCGHADLMRERIDGLVGE